MSQAIFDTGDTKGLQIKKDRHYLKEVPSPFRALFYLAEDQC